MSLQAEATLEKPSPGMLKSLSERNEMEGFLTFYGGPKASIHKKRRIWATFSKGILQIYKSEKDVNKSAWIEIQFKKQNVFFCLEKSNTFSIRLPHLMFFITETENEAEDWIRVFQNEGSAQKWNAKAPSNTPHFFVKVHFNRFTWCDYCEKFIWGLGYQGYICHACGFCCHMKCIGNIVIGTDEFSQCGSKREISGLEDLEAYLPADRQLPFITRQDDPHPEIDPKQIIMGRVIGEGGYGKVYEATLHGKPVAVKVLSGFDSDTEEFKEFLNGFKREIGIMSKCHHPNILLYMGACTTVPGKLMIVTERCKMDLDRLLVKNENPEKIAEIGIVNILKMAKEVAVAMTFLHERDPIVLHLDLKPANILIDEKGVIKVADFGETLMKGKYQSTLYDVPKGTPYFMAPEMLLGGKANTHSDVYSFGILLYEILYLRGAYNYKHYPVFVREVCDGGKRPPLDILPLTGEYPIPDLKILIEACWNQERNKRPSFAQIINDLNGIILQYSIPNKRARHFWEKNFFDPLRKVVYDEVPWAEFIVPLQREYPLDAAGLELLENFLGKSREDRNAMRGSFMAEKVVFIEYFSRTIEWFGPLVDLGENLKKAFAIEYFHGDIHHEEATYKLKSQGTGAFLVRLGHDSPGAFVVASWQETTGESGPLCTIVNTVLHYKLVDEAFFFNGERYDSLQSYIEKKRDTCNWKKPILR